MAIDLTLKGTAITNRDATPVVLNNPGAGGASKLKSVYGYLASVTASLSATSVIRLVEIPSNAVVHAVYFQSAAQAAGKFNIGVYKNTANGGLVAFTASDDWFASDVDCASAVVRTDVTNESAKYTIAKQNLPIWQAIGMAADPKSTLDVCLTVHTTDVTTGTGAVGLEVQYTD